MDRVSKSQFKARTLELLRQVEMTGKPLVVTARGKPTIELRPYRPPTDSPVAKPRGAAHRYQGSFEPVGLDDWEVLHLATVS
jgi:prevent-host-death family protein